MDHNYGLLDISLTSYNHLVREELPRMINEMRPIVWSEPGDCSCARISALKHNAAPMDRISPSQAFFLCPKTA